MRSCNEKSRTKKKKETYPGRVEESTSGGLAQTITAPGESQITPQPLTGRLGTSLPDSALWLCNPVANKHSFSHHTSLFYFEFFKIVFPVTRSLFRKCTNCLSCRENVVVGTHRNDTMGRSRGSLLQMKAGMGHSAEYSLPIYLSFSQISSCIG